MAKVPHSTLICQLKYSFRQLETQNETTQFTKNGSSFLIEYFIESSNIWPLEFKRNICFDICKILKITCDLCSNKSALRVYQIGFEGYGQIDNGMFYEEEEPSLDLAKLAGDYLLLEQSKETGGWVINVTRKFDRQGKISLTNGWYSAMAQGQAISLLCRLYSATGSLKYMHSATNGLGLFQVNVKNKGVQSKFEGGLWFEEYPTQPFSLYVLNGFIYSIYGLADYLTFCGNNSQAHILLADSLKSLVKRLNFYDTGTRTLYDLRHLSDPELYPNVARWDYHTLHVSQLYYLADWIQKSKTLFNQHNEFLEYARIYKIVASRWHDYIYGVWNKESQIKTI